MSIQQMMLTSPPSLSAVASPPFFGVVQNSSTVGTDNCTVTLTGGSKAATYSWVKIEGDNIIAVLPTSATTPFRATGMVLNETRHAVFHCVVTDGGSTAVTNQVAITLTRA